jgi:hypothetical protein
VSRQRFFVFDLYANQLSNSVDRFVMPRLVYRSTHDHRVLV